MIDPEWDNIPCGNDSLEIEDWELVAGVCTQRGGNFDNCVGHPEPCDCDNDYCDDYSWCSTIDQLVVTATEYRSTDSGGGPGLWKPLDPALIVCQDFNLLQIGDDKRVPPYCGFGSFCLGHVTVGVCDVSP